VCWAKDAEIPKMRRALLNLAVFKDLCRVQRPAQKWLHRLSLQYAAVLQDAPSFDKLRKRLLVDGEATLRNTFLAALGACAAPGKLIGWACV